MLSIGLLGYKIKMTHVFDNNKNIIIPVTILQCGPCYITKILNKNTSKYTAIQIGYQNILNSNKISKPLKGYFNKNNLLYFLHLKEYKVESINTFFLNQKLDVNIFSIGEKVSITTKSIGKGYTGNIKRNNFSRGPETHGSKHHRLQGSLGAGTDPARVFPGKKMSGRLGFTNCTIKNLEIIYINITDNLIYIKGSIPGKKNNLINIYKNKTFNYDN